MRSLPPLALAAALALAGCVKPATPPPGRPLSLTGYTLDGKGLDLSTLKGRPWIINVWRPG